MAIAVCGQLDRLLRERNLTPDDLKLLGAIAVSSIAVSLIDIDA